jgi:protein-serine/threonine kinase
MTQPDSSETETTQNEGEGSDSSDNPPPPTAIEPMSQSSSTTPKANGSYHVPTPSNRGAAQKTNGISALAAVPLRKFSVPLPTREADAHLKEPQFIGHLDNLSRSPRQTPAALLSPPSSASVSSSEDGESWSPSSSRAPSRPSSRAPSVSTGKSGALTVKTTPKQDHSRAPGLAPLTATDMPQTPRSKGPPSLNSDTGGQKFNLKDLLGSGPKLARKSSQRSTGSSKKSDSDAGGSKSVADSTTSLLKKYGVCEKVAIGKGATSVVRLVHKWDRSEEKIYAVKACGSPTPTEHDSYTL